MSIIVILFALLSTTLVVTLPHEFGHVANDIARPFGLRGGSEMNVAMTALFIPLAAIAGVTFLVALRILVGGRRQRSSSNDAEEARMIQDIYHGLMKMEQRVEALETLLIDKQRKGNE